MKSIKHAIFASSATCVLLICLYTHMLQHSAFSLVFSNGALVLGLNASLARIPSEDVICNGGWSCARLLCERNVVQEVPWSAVQFIYDKKMWNSSCTFSQTAAFRLEDQWQWFITARVFVYVGELCSTLTFLLGLGTILVKECRHHRLGGLSVKRWGLLSVLLWNLLTKVAVIGACLFYVVFLLTFEHDQVDYPPSFVQIWTLLSFVSAGVWSLGDGTMFVCRWKRDYVPPKVASEGTPIISFKTSPMYDRKNLA
jgi:hypothetical protein